MRQFTSAPDSIAISDLVNEIGDLLEHYSRLVSVLSIHQIRSQQIQTLHASLQIEGNTLSLSQVTAILDGKPVIAPFQEVLEVQNAFQCYLQLPRWKSSIQKNLLQAHQMMMRALIRDSGHFRCGYVGVVKGNQVIYMAPEAAHVPGLISVLFKQMKSMKAPPLVKACVFHYEFEHIHPFSDGNGRMGRLWQSLILGEWKNIFYSLPVDVQIWHQRSQYYEALSRSDSEGHPTAFVEFMLGIIAKTLRVNINFLKSPTPKAINDL